MTKNAYEDKVNSVIKGNKFTNGDKQKRLSYRSPQKGKYTTKKEKMSFIIEPTEEGDFFFNFNVSRQAS